MRINWILALLALSLYVMPALAKAVAPETYTGEASVTSQSEEERNQGIRSALGQVIVNVVGDPDVVNRSDVARSLGNASRYMVQYSYRQDAPGIDGETGLQLVVAFDRAAVDRILAQLGLASTTDYGPEPSGAPQKVRLWISGILSVDDYAAVMRYLQNSNLVDHVKLMEVRGDGIAVDLSLAGDLAHFLDAVRLENRLHVISAAPPVAGIDATLSLH